MKKLLLLSFTLSLIFGITGIAFAELYGGVDFPDGAKSFADQVISFTAGPNTTAPYNNPATALGAPNLGYDWVALGWGGSLVLKFTDNALTTSGSNAKDLWVFEIGAQVEPTFVSISKNGTNWIDVGEVAGATSGIDIDAYIGSGVTLGEKYSYVRLVDEDKRLSSAPWAGADIDAVGAISSAAPVQTPEPAAMVLLGLGLVGLAGVKRKFNK